MPAIVAENLTKFYGRTRGIENVNLEVREGEVFGFLGPNGAGKTTTIRILLDLIRPTRGRAAILGLDTRKDSIAVRRRVGYLPGEPGFYDHLTGEEYLGYLAGLRGGADPSRRKDLAQRLDIDLGRRIKALSHGMKQKVAIIQAFMHEADLLILDEPTSGLDPLMQHAFYELVRVERARGRTVFMSSHVLSEVERVCDRVAIIRGGTIAVVEDVETLTRKRVKKVQVSFGGAGTPAPAAPEALTAALTLPGVRDLSLKGDTAVFRVETTALGGVVKALAALPVTDLTIENPSLEDIFFEYFGPEAAAEVARAGDGDESAEMGSRGAGRGGRRASLGRRTGRTGTRGPASGRGGGRAR
jgi:ABC-2 type transport system ATP-binding protein